MFATARRNSSVFSSWAYPGRPSWVTPVGVDSVTSGLRTRGTCVRVLKRLMKKRSFQEEGALLTDWNARDQSGLGHVGALPIELPVPRHRTGLEPATTRLQG